MPGLPSGHQMAVLGGYFGHHRVDDDLGQDCGGLRYLLTLTSHDSAAWCHAQP